MKHAYLMLFACAVLAVASAAGADTFRVPSEYPTIQAGLDVASVGDTVLVAPGTYSDYTLPTMFAAVVASVPDGVVLRSALGSDVTFIDLGPLEGAALGVQGIRCEGHTSGTTVIEGFQVLGYPSAGIGSGVGISSCAHVEVRNCVFNAGPGAPNPSVTRGGCGVGFSDALIIDCAFIRCSGNSGAAISADNSLLVVESCTFIECENQGIRVQGGLGAGPHRLEVRNCLFDGVVSNAAAGGISAQGQADGILVDGCVFRNVVTSGAGAAMALAGLGARTVSNNQFTDINLPTGSTIVFLLNGSTILSGNTFSYCHQSFGSGIAVLVGSTGFVQFENNIVSHTSGATVFDFGSAARVLGCNVFWDNQGGIGHELGSTDRVADPLFCSPEVRDLTLDQWSPCLPANSLGCGQIGALGQGCGSVGVTPSSWGRLKALYRDGRGGAQ